MQRLLIYILMAAVLWLCGQIANGSDWRCTDDIGTSCHGR